MKFLKLKFEHTRLIKEKNKTNMLGSNVFFYPINKMHVYNSVCALIGRSPKPQLRDTDDKYMPFFKDISDYIDEGFIKIELINDTEKITTIKKYYNANATEAKQYTWKDCSYVTGTLLPIFINKISEVLLISKEKVEKNTFDQVIKLIQEKGNKNEKEEIVYSDKAIKDLIDWCKLNNCTAISNYIENKQLSSRPTYFGKRVYRGIVDVNKYSGFIYIPMDEKLFEELLYNTKGFSTILDEGIVTILDYDYVKEDEVSNMIKISDLSSIKKLNKKESKINFENTIYKDFVLNGDIEEAKKIIEKTGVDINKNKKEYEELMKKINSEKSKAVYKLNFFIEHSINRQINK